MNRKKQPTGNLLVAMMCFLVAGVLVGTVYAGGPTPGAIFTTTVDGSVVNANVQYQQKTDVYLDGGPGPNAPPGAAGLEEGDWYFMVTDPSGKELLSEDDVHCRRVHVNEHGVIDHVYEATQLVKVKGQWEEVDCTHAQGVDIDHEELGAITVQLYPFADTPNPGGVYKAWMTRVEDYVENYDVKDQGIAHGFVLSESKTDNFKVRKRGKPCDPPVIKWRKFSDLNYNGLLDVGEPEIGVDEFVNGGGWPIAVTEPSGVVNNVYTSAMTLAGEIGTYSGQEADLAGWVHTGILVDGQLYFDPNSENTAAVDVAGDCFETHEVIFLNGELVTIKVCKGYDANGDTYINDNEVKIAGWKIHITGVNVLGQVYDFYEYTGDDGCVVIDDLIAGTYTITEVLPPGDSWFSTGPTSYQIVLGPGDSAEIDFTNACKVDVTQHTKGFWQGPNGCAILTDHPEYLTYLNTLLPYQGGTYVTQGQDNCASGQCPSYTTLPFNDNGELGCYIVASPGQQGFNDLNTNRFKLAQQLAAFTLSNSHFGSLDNLLLLNGQQGFLVSDLIADAVDVWENGSNAQVQWWASYIDSLNNAGTLPALQGSPCSFSYNE